VENAGVENAAPNSRGAKTWHQMTRVENAGVENAAPSSGAYSGFQVRRREVRESEGRMSPSGVLCPVGSMGDGPKKKAQAFLCMKA